MGGQQWIIVYEKLFSLLFFWKLLEGDKISRVATNLENMENSGNLKNCENLRENLEKTQGNLNF